MGLKALLSKPFAAFAVWQMNKWKNDPLATQHQLLTTMIDKAKQTTFGLDHSFVAIRSYQDFKKLVPIRDYEDLKPYIDQVVQGRENILWPGKPLYFAKTSGTTSGVKYIPISKESMPEHIKAARNALLCYIHETGNTSFIDGKMIFLQGSPILDKKAGIYTGRLSGIVAHHVPAYLQRNNMPSFKTNCIDDWEQKVDAIVDETLVEDMRLISGIPPWIQMYFDRLLAKSGRTKVKDVFKNFSLLVYGGVNFEPYRTRLQETIGKKIDTIELYPASEGFVAFQDTQIEEGMLLQLDAGIFYEFIPVETYFDENPVRVCLDDVVIGQNYALILNTTAGLWGYSIGDTVRFVSIKPYRIVVTGRIKHYISAFGEHVIGEEVEHALLSVANKEGVEITEFTVSPQVNPPEGGLPYHEWFIEFAKAPADLAAFASQVDAQLQQKNAYYLDLIKGSVLKSLVIRSLSQHAFINYMRSQGKLGGQNKVPRLSNDRAIADKLTTYVL